MENNRNRKKYSLIGMLLILTLYFILNQLFVPESNDDDLIVQVQQTQDEFDLQSDEQLVSNDWIEGYVTRVVDGDTIIVEVEGDDLKVRLSGVDTPESVGDYKDNPEPFGIEASQFTKDMLLNQVVYLEFDVKEKDKYDRYLAYVWLVEPDSSLLLERCINAQLINEGYATWFNDYENRKYAEQFEYYHIKAQKNNIGLWARQ